MYVYTLGASDFEGTSSQLTFDASIGRACAQIPIIDDEIPESMELFAVLLSIPIPGPDTEGISIMPEAANITITDNDGKHSVFKLW